MALTFCPTLCCDNRCVMCPNEPLGPCRENDCLDEWRVVRELSSDEKYITVSGGEPTLRPEVFLRLLTILTSRCPNAHIQILSHGGRFSVPQFARELCRFKNHVHVEIPLHGPNASLHDRIAGKQGSFNNAVCAINNLVSEGIPVDVRVVVIRLNYQYLDQIVEYISCCLPGVRSVIFISMEATGTCRANLREVWIDYKPIMPHLRKAVYASILSRLQVRLFNYALCLLDSDLWSLAADSISPHKKFYPPVCCGCSVRSYCPGIFKSNEDILHDELRPIS
jgi:His-Xaa-Ser system radical SAM maturase HxsC